MDSLGVSKAFAEPKVDQFDNPVVRNANVSRLDVPVQDAGFPDLLQGSGR